MSTKIAISFDLKKLLASLFVILFALNVYGQVNFDFESGNLDEFLQIPENRWSISEYNSISGTKSLKHSFDNSESSKDRISFTHNQLLFDSVETSWEFKVRHAYSPSSSNNWAVFYGANNNAEQMTPDGNLNAYIIGVNFTGSDDTLRVWKMNDGNLTEIAGSQVNWQNDIGTQKAPNFKINRQINSSWTVEMDTSSNLTNWQTIISFTDTSLKSSTNFGVYYEYSSTKDTLLWIDDIHIDGYFYVDTIAPFISNAYFISRNELIISFNESVIDSTLKVENFSLNNEDVIDSIQTCGGNTYRVVFTKEFENEQEVILGYRGASDEYFNYSDFQNITLEFFMPEFGDIVINEIMFDPSPEINLPGYEYIEIYNTLDREIRINNWKIQVGESFFAIPELIIPSEGYILFCNFKVLNEYALAEKVIGLFSSEYELNNGGEYVALLDASSVVLSELNYSANWHSVDSKSEGGWSLEVINPTEKCALSDNWASSIDPSGGTPGYKNSVFSIIPDNYLKPIAFYARKDSSFTVEFNKVLNDGQYESYFYIEELNISPTQVLIDTVLGNKLDLIFETTFENSAFYHLVIEPGVQDCASQTMGDRFEFEFVFPDTADTTDLYINEVLFEPLPGCPEFVEIINVSDKYFDASLINICNIDTDTTFKNNIFLSDSSHIIKPGYSAITTDSTLLKEFYFGGEGCFIQVLKLPSLTNSKGDICLRSNGKLLDKLEYNDDWHSELISNTTGVSLERLNVELPANLSSSWHSAAEQVGFATPGYKNSQYINMSGDSFSNFNLESDLVSPDDDLDNDELIIHYNLRKVGAVANLIILNVNGKKVKTLNNTELLGSSGIIRWNCLSDFNRLVPIGLYIVYIEVSYADGNIETFKLPFVVGYKN